VARLRTVKPEFWTDERVGEVSVTARLLFIATWNFADDHGGIDRSAKQLKAQAFPYDNIDCEPLIQELLQVGLLIEYEVGGKKYLHINGFRKHQKVEKPAKPRIPLYESSPNPPRILPESSPSSSGSSLGIGVESSGVESTREAPDAPTAIAGRHPTQEGEMAIALRDLGVVVRSIDPVLIAWVKAGYTTQQAIDAVGIARIRKPHPEAIPANYLDKILREPARAPPPTAASRLTWRPPDDDGPNGCTPQNSKLSDKH
jgi:hypothetical protein